MDRHSVRVGAWLLRRTRGRIVRLWRRRALVLTTRGRRSGLPRTVVVQYFPDGPDMVVVAANSGMPTHPAWYLNLLDDPRAVVEVEGRTVPVRAVPMTRDEAAAWWPRVLDAAPDYARYPQRTDRPLPLVRLVPSDDETREASPPRRQWQTWGRRHVRGTTGDPSGPDMPPVSTRQRIRTAATRTRRGLEGRGVTIGRPSAAGVAPPPDERKPRTGRLPTSP